jgi:molybdopterin molybdotransferase
MELQKFQVQLSNNYKKLSGLTHFVKAFYNGESVSILTGQESYKLNTFARANGLVVLPESSTEFQAGDWVEFHLFPSF